MKIIDQYGRQSLTVGNLAVAGDASFAASATISGGLSVFGNFDLSGTFTDPTVQHLNAIGYTVDTTAIDLLSISPEEGLVYNVLATFAAGSISEAAGFLIAATFKKTSGTVSLVQTTSQLHLARNDTTWSAEIVVSGSAVKFRAHVDATNQVYWQLGIRLLKITAAT